MYSLISSTITNTTTNKYTYLFRLIADLSSKSEYNVAVKPAFKYELKVLNNDAIYLTIFMYPAYLMLLAN